MSRSVALLLVVSACAHPPSRAAPQVIAPSPVVTPAPIATAPPDRGPPVAEPKRVTVVALGVRDTYRLGPALFVAYTVEDQGDTVVHLARVADDGSLTEIAKGMPPSSMVTTRSGNKTLSGTPSALLGEADGPIWMAFTHYSVFGDAVMYRAERGAWSCVGRCGKAPDKEPWGKLLGTRSAGEIVPSGDVLAARSRGHLFRVVNRVSSEGPTYVLPRATGQSPTEVVQKIRRLPEEGEPFELADGSIVDVARRVPEAGVLKLVDGRSADDFWVLDDAGLLHARGGGSERVEPPAADVSWLVAEADGSVWVSAGTVAFAREASGWRGVRLAAEGWPSVVAARPGAIFVVHDERLLRVETP